MGTSYEEAIAQITGPGSPFEISEAVIRGERLRVFKNTPPSLRSLWDLARTRGDQTFLVYEDESWSWAEAMRHVDALAAALVQRFRIAPGDRVSIAMRNYPEWIIAFAAITSVGGVAVSLNAWWTADETDYGLRDSGSRVLIADPERLERAAATLADAGIGAIAVRSKNATLPAGAVRYEDAVVLGTPMPAVAIDPHADATILYTSGTTGRPKGAVSTHHAVLSALLCFGCQATVRNLLTPETDTQRKYPTSFILAVPLFHVTGCVAVMLSCVAAGCKLVIMHKWNAERALELIERERITNFVGVPTMSWDLLESPDFARRDTSSLKAVGGGGAPAPPELVRRIDRGFRNAGPGIGYGMTETNAYGPQNAGPEYLRRPTSCGRTVPVVEIRVTDESGTPLAPGEVGEIWFRGPNLIRGYWNRPEATAETIVDGLAAQRRPRPHRRRRLPLRRGPRQGHGAARGRERVLRGGRGRDLRAPRRVRGGRVRPAARAARRGGRGGVYLKPGAQLAADELQAHVRERLAGFKVPSIVEFASAPLPRNASGKILKRQIRDELAAARSG